MDETAVDFNAGMKEEESIHLFRAKELERDKLLHKKKIKVVTSSMNTSTPRTAGLKHANISFKKVTIMTGMSFTKKSVCDSTKTNALSRRSTRPDQQ